MASQKRSHSSAEPENKTEDVPLNEHAGKGIWHPPLWLLLLFSAALVFAIYSNTLHGPFVFDDVPNIRTNKFMQVTHLSPGALRDAAFKSPCSNRPVANLTFAMNYYFHGYDLPGYHLVNIAIHILAGFLLFFLVRDTLVLALRQSSSILASGTGKPALIAFFAMLLWLVHPLNTQAVTYIVQRMDSMAAMLYVLSFVCYIKGRCTAGSARWSLFGVSMLSGLLALGTKEISATLPVFIFLYEWYFFQDLSWSWMRRQLPWLAGFAVIFGILAFLFIGTHPFAVIAAGYETRDFTMAQRVMTEFRVVLSYLGQLAFPHPSRLSLEHDVAVSTSLLTPVTTVLSLAALILLMAAAAMTAKKERLVSFAILWYLGNLAIESSFIGLEIVFEHRAYLPSMFLAAVLAAAVIRCIKPRWAGVAFLCAIISVFSFWTYQRNYVWADEMRLLRDGVQKAPGWARTHTNLGLALLDRQLTDEAIEEFYTALKLSPNRYALYRNLAFALTQKQRYEEAIGYYQQGLTLIKDSRDKAPFLLSIGDVYEKMGKYPEALAQYRQALAADPGSGKAHCAIGQAYAKQGKLKEALDEFSEAVRIDPGSSQAWNGMGNVHAQQGNDREAAGFYQKAIDADPANPDAHYNLANIYLVQGREGDAVREYGEALRLSPGYTKARTGLAGLYYGRGELDKAAGLYQEAVNGDPGDADAKKALAAVQERRKGILAARLKVEKALEADPRNPLLLFQLGELYRLEGSLSSAEESYRKALSIRQDFPQAMRQLAVVYSLTGDKGRAVEELQKIVRLHPDDPDAYYNIACLYALRNDREEAVKWLGLAVDKGFQGWDLLKKDKDLYNIKETAFYRELIKGK